MNAFNELKILGLVDESPNNHVKLYYKAILEKKFFSKTFYIENR
jgi:hypothetical protein